MTANRRMLKAAVRQVQQDAEELAHAAEASHDEGDQLAARTALENWLVLDTASRGSEDEVDNAIALLESDFPELLPS